MSQEQHFARFCLPEIPELMIWFSVPLTRQMLMQSSSQTDHALDRFIDRATALVIRDLPSAYSSDQQISPALRRIKRLGYPNSVIAQSFAYSWLAGSEYLFLPRLKSNLANNAWLKIAPPLLLTLVLVLKLIYLAIATLGADVVTFIYASPGFVLVPAIPIYLLIRYAWLKALPRLFKDGGIQQPEAVHPLAGFAFNAIVALPSRRFRHQRPEGSSSSR